MGVEDGEPTVFIGRGSIVTVNSSNEGEQVFVEFAVKVSVTVPVAKSLVPGVYIVDKAASFPKPPSPDVVHKVPLVAQAFSVPVKLTIEPEQIERSLPASISCPFA